MSIQHENEMSCFSSEMFNVILKAVFFLFVVVSLYDEGVWEMHARCFLIIDVSLSLADKVNVC